MLPRLAAIASLVLALLLPGCATPAKKVFLNDAGEMSQAGNPVFLMTVTLRNIYRPLFQPKLTAVNIERSVVKDNADKINFTMENMAKIESGSPVEGNTYLLRMELEQGEYVIRGLSSTSKYFLTAGHYFTPLHVRLESNEQGVFYIGHINASIRERKDTEFRAGPKIPVIYPPFTELRAISKEPTTDQEVSGALNGTFDVEIVDQWDKDGPKFLAHFPALSAVTVQMKILPPFDRMKAQQLSGAK